MADAKISQLTELTLAEPGDLLVIVDDPTGTPVTKKITALNFSNSIRKSIFKSADQSVTNSTAYVDDADFVFAIAANEVWLIRLFILVTGPTAADLKFAVNVPSGATGWLAIQSALVSGSTTFSGDNVLLQTTDLTDGANFVTATITGSTVSGTYEVLVRNGATPGNFQFRWAQNAANATPVTIKADCYLEARRLS
jgi:hypothetical protein